MEMDGVESTSCDNSEAQGVPDSETPMQIPSPSEDKEFETEEKVCLNITPESSLHAVSSHVDSDEEPRIASVSSQSQHSANMSLPKTTLLGKLKAKQRLNAFLALRPNVSCTSPQKKFKDCEEGGAKVENKTSAVKKTNKIFPDDIAKAVIEEIEMIKKVEIAMIESIEQEIYEKSQRKSRSRSKSRSRERGGRYKEQSYRKYKSHSRSSDRRSKYLGKESYPKNWAEMKEKHLKLEDVKEIKSRMSRHQKKYNECQDFRKQALFSKPSLPLKPLVIKSITGPDKVVPVGYIRYTRANPSISYNVNFVKTKNVHVSEKEVYDMAPKSHKEILEKLKDSSAPSKISESPKKSPRKWYLKTPLASVVDVTECKLLEPSLGLSILQNYTDEEEEEEEKYEVNLVVDETAEISNPKIQSNTETDTAITEIKEEKKVETNKDVDVVKHKDSRSKKDAPDNDQGGEACNTESLQKELSLDNMNAQDLAEEPKKRKHSKKTESKKSSKKCKTERKKKDQKEKHEKKKKKVKGKKKKETVDREEDKDKAKNAKETEKKGGCEDKSDKKSENKKVTTKKSNMKLKYKEQVDDAPIKNEFNFETYIGNVRYDEDEFVYLKDDDKIIEKISKVKEDGKQLKEKAKKPEVIPCYVKEKEVQHRKPEDSSCVKEDKAQCKKSEDLNVKRERKVNEDADVVARADDKKKNEKIKQDEVLKKCVALTTRRDDVLNTVHDIKKETGSLKPETNIKLNTSNVVKVDNTIINVKEESSNLKKKTEEVAHRNSKPEPELRTPDTEEYHSHWESDEDVSNAISYSPLPSRKPIIQVANTSWESDEEVVKNVPIHKQKTRGRYVEVSPPRSLDRRNRKLLDAPEVERSLEMPLNIKHLSRRKLGNDARDPLGVLYSEDSWERGEYLKLRNDIETEKLKQERESLSEERRLLEKEKRKLAEKLEQVTSNLVYRTYEGPYKEEIVDSSDSELRSIQQKRKELLERRPREKKDKKNEKKTKDFKPEGTETLELVKTVNVETNHLKLEVDNTIAEVTSEVDSFGKATLTTEVVKRKRRKKRWESIEMDMENKLSIDEVLIEETTSRATLDDYESKPSIDEVLVEDTKPLNLVDSEIKKDFVDKQNAKEQERSNNKKNVETVLNKISREIISEPTLSLNPVASVNKVVILESEYEEFMKAVTSETYTDDTVTVNHEDKIGANDEHKTKFISGKKKRKRSTSSSSSSSSSSYSSGTDSSSSYSSTSTSSSSSDEESHKKTRQRKSKIHKTTFDKVKENRNMINELDIEDLKGFPISKDPEVKDNMVIHIVKTESGLDILSNMGMEKGESVDFSVPLPVPSPAVVPPSLIKIHDVKDESPISSTNIDSTTSPIKRPMSSPTKFLAALTRKQQLDDVPISEVLALTPQPTVNSNSETKFSNSFQVATVQYPILEEKCHTSFSLSLKQSVSRYDVCLNENSRSQDFTDFFAKSIEPPIQEVHPVSKIETKAEVKEVVTNMDPKPESVRFNKRERSLSPFVKKREHSPKRLGNLSPRQNRSVSPKRSRNLSPRWSPLSSSPKRSRISSPRPTRNRDSSPRSTSPKRSRKSDVSRRRSPPRRYLSEREYSPRRRNLTPRRSISPPRYRDISPRRNYSPRRNLSPHRMRSKNLSPRYRSISPRYRDASPGRRCYSPRGRDVSPRRRNYSPRRRRSPNLRNRRYSFSRSPSIDRSKKEPIQLTLQRLAGLDDYTSSAIKSPINSPLDGFKRSLADSTISDDQLLQQNSEDFTESPRNPSLFFENKSTDLPCSPKRIPLDERISFVLGMEKEGPKPINTTYSGHYAYNQYTVQYDHHFTSYENQVLQKPNYVISGGSTCNQDKSLSTRVVQIGNVLEVVPTENIQSISPSKEYVPQQKILQVGNMLQIVPAPRMTTTMEPSKPPTIVTSTPPCVTSCIIPAPVEAPNPVLPLSPSVFVVEKMSPEALMKQKISERKAQRQLRHEEREKKRREKEKRRKEKEKQRQIRIKQKTDNMIKQAILLETEALALGEDLENQGTPDGGCTASDSWSSMPLIVSNPSIRPAGKGILISGKFSKQSFDDDGSSEARKSVTFADGIIPGEGTSPSGGEELSSPPPMKIPLPKEKRYTKSIKIKKQKKIKVPKKKKIKVKIIRKALDSQDDDSEDDNLPPPSPPPGSPPPHIFPPRIKTHTINNIHPAFISGMQSFPVHQFRPNMSVNMPLPPHGPPPHSLPLLVPPGHNMPQQGPPHSSARHLSLPHETQLQQHSGLPHPPPPGLHH